MIDNTSEPVAVPICPIWELTHAGDLSSSHGSSGSGGRDPRELSTAEGKALIDEFEGMRIRRIDIGGGEPTVRADFWELVDHATTKRIGVKFCTNGIRITPHAARRIAGNGDIDVRISLAGATEAVDDAVRGTGAYRTAVRAMELLASSGVYGFELSVAVNGRNVGQLNAFEAIADMFGAQLRLTRLHSLGSGRDGLTPTADQQQMLDDWLADHDADVLTADAGAGCLIDPVGDVYAFAGHDRFRVGNIRAAGGFESIWRGSKLCGELPARDPAHRRRPVAEYPVVRRSA